MRSQPGLLNSFSKTVAILLFLALQAQSSALTKPSKAKELATQLI
jgi:hypothetical protein